MQAISRLLIASIVLRALPATRAWAEIVTIELTGQVTYVDEYSTTLQQLFHIGDPVTGTYTYNTDAFDRNPRSSVGDYHYDAEPYGVKLEIDGFSIQTDPENVDFLLEVGNNHAYSSWDHYLVYSYNNKPIPNGMTVWFIAWNLRDSSGTALTNDALPQLAPSLGDWDYNELRVDFGLKGGSTVGARITSVQVIAEPTTFAVIGIGSMLLVVRRKR